MIASYSTCYVFSQRVSSVLVSYCSRLSLIYVTRVYAAVLVKSTCLSFVKCVLPNRSNTV
jgi:hypothetical protein